MYRERTLPGGTELGLHTQVHIDETEIPISQFIFYLHFLTLPLSVFVGGGGFCFCFLRPYAVLGRSVSTLPRFPCGLDIAFPPSSVPPATFSNVPAIPLSIFLILGNVE